MQHFGDGEIAESYNRCSAGSKAIAMTPKEGAAEIAGWIQATIKKVGGGELPRVRVLRLRQYLTTANDPPKGNRAQKGFCE